MANAAATNTENPGVEVRSNSIRAFFMFKRARLTHRLRLEPTRNNIKHAVGLRSALFAPRNGSYNVRRAEIRLRPPCQTRHAFACLNLTAGGKLAFIANQMGHKDCAMLVTVCGRWIDTASSRVLERIWEGMRNMAQTTPKLHQEQPAQTLSC